MRNGETIQLPPLYYLHNFRLALATLTERYVGLLSADEAGFIEQFECLSEPAQCLLTRLVMRKGSLFRRASLQYAEVPDLEGTLQALVAIGWLDPDPTLSADELSRVLNSDELRLAVGIRRGRRSCMGRPGIHETQLALPLQEQPAIHRSLSQWNPSLTAGSVIQLCVEPLTKRLQSLFFGNHYQSWTEFVLVDLGVNRYESVPIDANARAFHSREEMEHFHRLNECRARLDAGEPASVVRESALMPQAASGWLASRFMQLQLRIGELLEDEDNPQLALQSYRGCNTAEGLVRAVRLQMRLKLLDEARRDALVALELPCSEAQQEAIERALARMKLHREGAPRKRRSRDNTEMIELLLPKLGERRIELAVIERLRQPDSQLFFVENSLLPSLFGLLCWEAVFAPIQGAFFHPFQAAPADLYTAEFRERRALHFRTLLGLLESGEHEPAIWGVYRAKAGIRSNFVRWGKLRPGLLRLALQCIPASHLKLCFERLLDDLEENTGGMPDLIQFWPAERRYRLIEVKGPGDRLKNNQRRWFSFFDRHAIPAAICQVRWHPDAKPKTATPPLTT